MSVTMETAKSESSAEARNSNPLPLFFGSGTSTFVVAEIDFVYLSFVLQAVSDFFYFLCSIAIMKSTLETEEMLLQLYVEVKTVYNNKMKKP